MKPQVYPIFPEPILEVKDIGVDQDRILNLYEKQEWGNTNADDDSDKFLKISNNLKVLKEAEELEKIFVGIINEYTKDIMRYKNRFYLTTSWFVKTEKNKISVLHNHGNAMISAVYYFGLSDTNKAKIVFEKPFLSQFDLKPMEYNTLNCIGYDFEMENDSVLVFPSYLKHKVVRHENNEDRKSLAMNFMPKGIIGTGSTEIYLSGPDD